MVRANLLKPKIELFNASKSRRKGKEWVVDLGIVHFEFNITNPLIMTKISENKF